MKGASLSAEKAKDGSKELKSTEKVEIKDVSLVVEDTVEKTVKACAGAKEVTDEDTSIH